jgi:hypothetical protein
LSAVLAFAAAAVGLNATAACGSGGDAAVALEAGAARCPAPSPADAAEWIPPSDGGAGPCDTAALDLLGALFRADPAPSFAVIEAAVRGAADASAASAACAACVFTRAGDATWGPVVWVDVDAGTAFVNYGACYAHAPGGSDACGRAVHQQTRCLEEVCSLDGCRPEGLRLCAQQALQERDGCGRFDVATACDQGIAQLAVVCRNPVDVVTRLCAQTAASDGGTDASLVQSAAR